MTHYEKLLLFFMGREPDRNMRASMLQSHIAEFGPLSEAAGAKARELLQ